MKRTCISLAVVALLGSGVAQAYTPTVTTLNNNFTMVGATNGNTGGTNDVTFTWDGTYRTSIEADGLYNATLSSPTAFAGKKWTAHHVNVYGPGTYTFNANCPSGGVTSTTYNPTCITTPGLAQTLTVPPGKVGAHMLFNWSTSTDIDVIVVWDMNKSWNLTGTASPFNITTNVGGNTADTVWNGVSIDADADTFSGAAMIDGPFSGQSANFSVNGILPLIPAVLTPNPTGTGIGTGSVVTVAFNQSMDPATLTLASFTVKAGGATVCGGSIAASNGNKTFTCTPTALAPNTTYTATVTTAAQNIVPVGLASNYTWTFTTGAAAATTTLSSTAAPGTATVSIPSGNGSLATVGLLTSAQVSATPPANVTFNEGLVNYKVTGVTGGSTVTVTIVFPASIAGKTLYKVDTTAASPVYTAIPDNGVAYTRVNSTTITIPITDCTAAPCTGYDTNATSGIIEDPIGAGTTFVTVDATLGSPPGGGGCAFGSNSKFDPAMVIMLLGSLGYLGWKRKQRD